MCSLAVELVFEKGENKSVATWNAACTDRPAGPQDPSGDKGDVDIDW